MSADDDGPTDDGPPAPAYTDDQTAELARVDALIAGGPEVLGACPLPAQVRTRRRAVMTRETAATVKLYEGAALVVVERSGAVRRGEERHGRGERRLSTRFTSRARMTFLRALATVDDSAPALFVTLTWPTWAAPEGREWQEPWNRFRMMLARRYPSAAGFYKRELTQAGVVHLHLLVYGVTWRAMREFVPSAWARSVHAPDEALRERVGTEVGVVRRGASVRRYATKYVTKAMMDDDGADPSGPWWGRFNEGQIPTVVPVALAVPDAVAVRMIRTARRMLNAQRRRRGWGRLRWHRFRRMTLIAEPATWRALAVLYGA